MGVVGEKFAKTSIMMATGAFAKNAQLTSTLSPTLSSCKKGDAIKVALVADGFELGDHNFRIRLSSTAVNSASLTVNIGTWFYTRMQMARVSYFATCSGLCAFARCDKKAYENI